MKISEMPGLEISGLLSHFSEADLSDRSYAILQFERFKAVQETLSDRLKRKVFSHIANSAAVLSFEKAYFDSVRPGLMLYGYSPFAKESNPTSPRFTKGGDIKFSHLEKGDVVGFEKESISAETIYLIPAMTVKTKLISLRNVPPGTPISYGRTFITKRQSRIGVIALGYADGYFRFFSNNSEVLVKGKRVPVVGRVCMDLTMIDLTDTVDVGENDEVIILGTQGTESITADELALKANTISYEILTSLGSRAKRTYVETN
jgi:alanine racemase